jgi:subtilisin family serine protease
MSREVRMRWCSTILVLCLGTALYADERQARLESLGVTRWHHAGFTGRNTTVAILDSGFRGYRTHLSKALPTTVTVKSFRHDADLEAKDSSHGILCAEIIHAIAPEAKLLFANWEPDQPDTFLAAIKWAKEQGASVISCSIAIPGWGDGRGGGAVNTALAKLLTDDVVMVAPTGNMAQRHWSGTFRGDGKWHEWEPGRTETILTPTLGSPLTIDLVAAKGSRYRIRLLDEGREETQVRFQTSPNGISARLIPTQKRYYLRVEHWDGPREPFRFTVIGATLQDHTLTNSIVFPAENERVFAIGAVDAKGIRCEYSGCGGQRRKPDFVAQVPFPSHWRKEPFDGTSAAAPQVAGIVALVRGRYPDWSAKRVYEYLRLSANDLGPHGQDAETGYGLIQLPKP